MKHLLPAAALLAILLLSCDDDPSTPPPPPPEPIVQTNAIRDVDYIKNKFFLIDDPRVGGLSNPQVETVEVYRRVTQQDLIIDPSIIRRPGWVIADSTADGSIIQATAQVIDTDPASVTNGLQQDFKLMQVGEDFDFLIAFDNKEIIGIELFDPIPNTAQKSIGISYIAENGTRFGGSYHDYGIRDPATGQVPAKNGPGDQLMLKMLKAPEQRPTGPFGTTWWLAMRNAYHLGFSTIDPATLTVRIEDVLNDTRTDASRPEGSDVPYAQIFGLDRYGATENDPPDGRIDNYYLNWSADIERGILWMPTGRGFAPPAERVDVWTNGEFEFSGPYLPQYEKALRIYDELLSPTGEQDMYQYFIEATVTTPAP